jgi:anaerobic C4-dicarboxylate transporter
MIDAWDVYWIMQLDQIRGGMMVFSIIFGVALAIGALVGAVVVFDTYGNDKNDAKQTFKRWMSSGVAVFVVSFLLASLLPSSKTAAAMIVLPAITSDTVVQTVAPEARELYELAKDALRSVAKDKASEHAKKD